MSTRLKSDTGIHFAWWLPSATRQNASLLGAMGAIAHPTLAALAIWAKVAAIMTNGATQFPDLNAILAELVQGIQAILGPSLVGIYLQGSFAVGGADEHSDADFIVVVEEELSDGQVDALQAMHGHIYDRPNHWAKHLEGSYFPRAVLANLSPAGERLWYLDHGSRFMSQSDHCNTLVVRRTVRDYGIPLAGPPPASLMAPIPVDSLRREMRATMADWGREILADPDRYNNRFYQSFIVLSYCRMLHDIEMGRPGAKPDAAAWAKANLDPAWHGLIDRTWAGRPDPATSVRTPADPADFAATLAFIEYAIEQSRRQVTEDR
jgi:hypothetical protein